MSNFAALTEQVREAILQKNAPFGPGSLTAYLDWRRSALAALDALAEALAETEEALKYVEGHLELAEEWEPGENSLADENAQRVIRDSLGCARSALAALAAGRDGGQ